jgi:hypothetical protein
MSAIEEFAAILENTDVMKQALRILKEEPAFLLAEICREYERSSRQPIPDHRLRSIGYMGEAATKALISAGLVKKQSGGSTSLYVYEPTAEGLKWWEKLKAEGFYKR